MWMTQTQQHCTNERPLVPLCPLSCFTRQSIRQQTSMTRCPRVSSIPYVCTAQCTYLASDFVLPSSLRYLKLRSCRKSSTMSSARVIWLNSNTLCPALPTAACQQLLANPGCKNAGHDCHKPNLATWLCAVIDCISYLVLPALHSDRS